MTRSIRLTLLLAVAAVAPLPLCVPAAEPGATELPAGAAAVVATVTARVEAVDLATREVKLITEDGKVVTIVAGDEVRNLPQVKVGDIVTFEYYQVLAVALEPSASPIRERIEREEAARAPLGAKPAGVVQKTVDITGTVEAIDRKQRVVTLRGPERSVTVKVADDVNLERIENGQTVLARYVEGFGISVAAPDSK
jgi:Cu/Ag efflux protein CusF